MTQAIWFRPYTIQEVSRRFGNTMAAHLNITLTELGPDYLKASMPVTENVHQPMGLLHGGANVALAETVGSIGANLVMDPQVGACVGQEINANHLRGVRSGIVTATARPVHIGSGSQVWDIRIHDERERLTCISRLTMAVIRPR